ncbi:MAG TPA: ShlB/FhaC/HecB family hemolysin secretion/activation protein [Caulobacteraceae bacterium]|jgi:hemolysin activation/secretion protein|nr:ShlB/FhaC/HecB family hemolysin secretion/activation protein [Caulobacteraceae bacterium]
MLQQRSLASLAAACVLGGAGAVFAQAAPPVAPQVNPGLINQQNQRNQRQIEQQAAPTSPTQLVIPPGRTIPAAPAPGGPTVVVKRVVFDKSKFLSKAELDALAAQYIGTRVDISQIQKLVKSVNDLYAAKGVATGNAYLPPQNLDNGVLHIGLVEGKLGATTVKGASRLSADYLRYRIGEQPGEVVDTNQLADRLAGFNRTGVAQVQASLQAGSQFGLTNIQLAVTEPPANSLDLFVDDQGVASVGRYEGGFLYQSYAPLGVDDRFTLYGVFADGDAAIDGAYNLPFDRSGGRLGFSASYGAIRVINGAFESLDIRGASTTVATNASQPIFVNQHWLILANAAVSYTNTISRQAAVEVTANTTDKGTGGLTVGYTDQLFSGNVAATFSRAQTDIAVANTSQDFNLYNGTFSGLLHLPRRFDVLVDGAFQASSAALLPGDQLFQIGGPTTVRGYSTDAVAGSSGFYANFELHHDLSLVNRSLTGFVFYDRGSVYNPKPAVTTLNSVGLGLSMAIRKYVTADLTAGFPITEAFDKQPACEIYFRLTAKLR